MTPADQTGRERWTLLPVAEHMPKRMRWVEGPLPIPERVDLVPAAALAAAASDIKACEEENESFERCIRGLEKDLAAAREELLRKEPTGRLHEMLEQAEARAAEWERACREAIKHRDELLAGVERMKAVVEAAKAFVATWGPDYSAVDEWKDLADALAALGEGP